MLGSDQGLWAGRKPPFLTQRFWHGVYVGGRTFFTEFPEAPWCCIWNRSQRSRSACQMTNSDSSAGHIIRNKMAGAIR